ncbi:MAG TPA: DNA mismatch repair endonuclease MutH [Gammaproteobacteria bacterium]|nr:DNA mismatch repair endonuclease MutH [Gammaproteobacteria bacterium]
MPWQHDTWLPSPPLSESELLAQAERLAGLRLAELARLLDQPVPDSLRTAKGWVGQLLETALGASAGALPEPDFRHIGVELKTLPLNRQGEPRESTYVCTVPLTGNTGLSWETSWVRRKLARVLWVPVEAAPELVIGERRIGMPLLWSPDAEEEAILRQDWEELMELVVTGQLEELSARHGTWLQIRPKAANARARCHGYDAEGRLTETLPRGFYLRTAFTRRLLNRHYRRHAL